MEVIEVKLGVGDVAKDGESKRSAKVAERNRGEAYPVPSALR